jgi:hypothetical protein
MRETQYSIGSCPLCRVGDVIIVKSTKTAAYLLMCDECDLIWNNPSDALDYHRSVKYDPDLGYFSSTVTEEELEESGWQKHVIRLL